MKGRLSKLPVFISNKLRSLRLNIEENLANTIKSAYPDNNPYLHHVILAHQAHHLQTDSIFYFLQRINFLFLKVPL